jgi:hypothetical protein
LSRRHCPRAVQASARHHHARDARHSPCRRA